MVEEGNPGEDLQGSLVKAKLVDKVHSVVACFEVADKSAQLKVVILGRKANDTVVHAVKDCFEGLMVA